MCVCWEEGAHPALAPRSHPLFQGPSGAAVGPEKDLQFIHWGRSLCPGCFRSASGGVFPRLSRRQGAREEGAGSEEAKKQRDTRTATEVARLRRAAASRELPSTSRARARLADPGAGRSCGPGRAERVAGGASGGRRASGRRAAGSVSAGICAAASARSPGTERRIRRLAHGHGAPALCSVPVRRGFPEAAATAPRRPRRPAAGGAGAARSARLSSACPTARRAAPSRGAPGLQTRAGGASVFMNPEDVREALQGS